MKNTLRIALCISFLLGALPVQAVQGAVLTSSCVDGPQSTGALFRICMPEEGSWNGDLVIFAHGYVGFNQPVRIPEDQLELPDGTSIPATVNGLGYAFATTSYRGNGLVVLEGIEDILDLVDVFVNLHGQPNHIYLVGASEGGIITALAVEQHPEVIDGGLAACGPIGDFKRQVDYWGDFRVVFDYFFPSLIPGSPVAIPPEVIDGWEMVFEPTIRSAISSYKGATDQLLRVTRAPIDWGDPDSIEETVLGLIWYNVFATNDGIEKLGGQPFGNQRRFYFGSKNDFRLNRRVQRFTADPAAIAEIEANYQTSGRLESPLVTLHTTGDPIIPYWHVPLYRYKALIQGSSLLHSNIPVLRYGHCNFKVTEVLVAFAVLVLKTTATELTGIEQVLPDLNLQAEFLRLAEEHGALK